MDLEKVLENFINKDFIINYINVMKVMSEKESKVIDHNNGVWFSSNDCDCYDIVINSNGNLYVFDFNRDLLLVDNIREELQRVIDAHETPCSCDIVFNR